LQPVEVFLNDDWGTEAFVLSEPKVGKSQKSETNQIKKRK